MTHVSYKATVNFERYYPYKRDPRLVTMGRFGSRAQRDARDLFDERDIIIEKMNESSMHDIHKNISHYEEYMNILDCMLDDCEPWLSDEELVEELKYDPDYENIVYDLSDYRFDDRNYVLKSEIQLFRFILCEKLIECEKYLDDITVNSGVAIALLWIHENYSATVTDM